MIRLIQPCNCLHCRAYRVYVLRKLIDGCYHLAEVALSDRPASRRVAYTFVALAVLYWGYAAGAAMWGWPWPGMGGSGVSS